MRRPLVAGNWKMNGNAASIADLLDGIVAEFASTPTQCEVLVFPAFVYLPMVCDRLAGSLVGVGAQDVDVREAGAVTGAVSVSMVKDIGVTHAIVGHSERRALFGEGDETVAEKVVQCIAHGVIPIVCVGETLEQRQRGETLAVVTRQLQAVTSVIGADSFGESMVAYEPIWAIGTGESATPGQAEEVHAGLRACLAEQDEALAGRTRILYGGSVTAENAASLFEKANVDGALVGGASLKSTSFAKICRAATETA